MLFDITSKYMSIKIFINIFIRMSIVEHSQTTSFLHRNRSIKKKGNTIQYILNQEQADQKAKNILDYLQKNICYNHQRFGVVDEYQHQETINNLQSNLYKLQKKHRSYNKIKSLTLNTLAKLYMQQNNLKMAFFLIEEAMIYEKQLMPHFYIRSLLFRILLLSKQDMSNIHLMSNSDNMDHNKEIVLNEEEKIMSLSQFIDDSSTNDKNSISLLYQQLKRTKIKVNPQQYAVQERLWQSKQINQLLIYQYHFIVKQITILNPKKGYILYHKGIEISKKILGPHHNLTEILINIHKIRKQRKNLCKSENKIRSYRTRKMKGIKSTEKNVTEQQEPKIMMTKTLGEFNNRKPSLPKNQRKILLKTAYNQRSQKKKLNKPFYIPKQKQQQYSILKLKTPQMEKLQVLNNLYSDSELMKNQTKAIAKILSKKEAKNQKLSHQYFKPYKNKIKGGTIINQEQLIKKSQKMNAQQQNIIVKDAIKLQPQDIKLQEIRDIEQKQSQQKIVNDKQNPKIVEKDSDLCQII